MSGKRVLVLYGTLLFCFAAVVCRLYWLCSDTAYGARAAAQSVVTLQLPARRGNFYDHRGQLLTGQTTRWMALCVPGEGSYARLFAYTDAAGQAALYQKRNAASPFLLAPLARAPNSAPSLDPAHRLSARRHAPGETQRPPQPTDPSRLIPMSFCVSAMNSMGSC